MHGDGSSSLQSSAGTQTGTALCGSPPTTSGFVAQYVPAAHTSSPAQHVEFVAKRLLHGTDPAGVPVLLGSPVYVALVD